MSRNDYTLREFPDAKCWFLRHQIGLLEKTVRRGQPCQIFKLLGFGGTLAAAHLMAMRNGRKA